MQSKEILNFTDSLNEIEELWQLHTVAESDTHLFKLIKFEGEFEWHAHCDSKTLMVMEGTMHIDFRDRDAVNLTKGDSYIVQENIEHKPVADGVCGILLIEKKEPKK